jgi:hypothetical protein
MTGASYKRVDMKRFLIFATVLLLPWALRAGSFDPAHAAFDTVLKQHVSDGWVDYAALKAHRKPLDSYLGQLATVPEREFKTWPEKQRLAFLINQQ